MPNPEPETEDDRVHYLDAGGKQISADSLRARLSHETQRDIDARMASYFSTSSEMAAFDAEAVAELYKHSR